MLVERASVSRCCSVCVFCRARVRLNQLVLLAEASPAPANKLTVELSGFSNRGGGWMHIFHGRRGGGETTQQVDFCMIHHKVYVRLGVFCVQSGAPRCVTDLHAATVWAKILPVTSLIKTQWLQVSLAWGSQTCLGFTNSLKVHKLAWGLQTRLGFTK